MRNSWIFETLGKLGGKVAIITGAADGIGLATTRRFLDDGAEVVAVDLPHSKLEAVFGDDSRVLCLHVDVSAPDAPERIVSAAVDRFGGVDILFNNAGICPTAALQDLTLDGLHKVMSVNVEAVLRLTQRAVTEMRRRGGGRIINVGSVMSTHAMADCAAYGISKHAVASLTKSMCLEYGGWGITANYVCPGAIVTGINRQSFAENPEFRDFWVKKAPAGRLGQPEDIAGPVAFLASDDARFVTGHGLVVDGGALQNL